MSSYTWDRANRLLSMGGASYQYDGEGRRVQQAVGATVTKYLLDIQPGLAVVLSETKGSNVIRNVFSPRGIHAQQDSSDNWQWIAQDGLGNVREVLDNSSGVLESRNYGPYGDAFDGTITSALGYEAPNFGFTGELADGSGLLDLRARRYNAGMGVFASLDPFEGTRNRAMSLNGYSWVEGNVPNWNDPSGEYWFLDSTSPGRSKPSPDLSDVGLQYYLSKLIQLEALGNPNVHAEYPVGTDVFIDLLGNNDTERKVRYWEIKPNSSNGVADGKISILNAQWELLIAASKGELSSNYRKSVEDSNFTYNWNSYKWEPGLDYRMVILGQVTGDNRYWFARQATDNLTGTQIPGVIVYWYETRENDPVKIPWFLGVERRNLPKPEDVPQRPRVPNIIPFPSEEGQESDRPAAAACGILPIPVHVSPNSPYYIPPPDDSILTVAGELWDYLIQLTLEFGF